MDFAACAANAGQNPSVRDDAAADPGSESYHNQIAAASAAALPHFAQGRHVCIVSGHNRQMKNILQCLFDTENAPS